MIPFEPNFNLGQQTVRVILRTGYGPIKMSRTNTQLADRPAVLSLTDQYAELVRLRQQVRHAEADGLPTRKKLDCDQPPIPVRPLQRRAAKKSLELGANRGHRNT